jgi:hypothetical protein
VSQHKTSYWTLAGAQCGKFFPDKPAKARTELACQLITRQFHIKSMVFGEEKQACQGELDRQVAGMPTAASTRLDVMLKRGPAAPLLWIDVASVHPLAESDAGCERARAQCAFEAFKEDPTAATRDHLRTQPTVLSMANCKTMKYKPLTLTAALEVDSGERTSRAPIFHWWCPRSYKCTASAPWPGSCARPTTASYSAKGHAATVSRRLH